VLEALSREFRELVWLTSLMRDIQPKGKEDKEGV